MPPRPDVETLATKLLEAQVEFVMAELAGDRLREVIARDVADGLELAGRITMKGLFGTEGARAALRRLADLVWAAPAAEVFEQQLAAALYDLPAADEHLLGDFLARDAVEAIVVKMLELHQLRETALDRLSRSPLVATVATRFVTRLVTDVVAENRARAEKLVPGMRSMISLGTSAASRLKSPFDKQLDALLGAATDRGGQAALERTGAALRDTVQNAPLRETALELWDLHADEPISALRDYLSGEDLRELIALVRGLLAGAARTPFAGALLDAVADTFMARYEDADLATVLRDLGLTEAVLVEQLQRALPPLIDAARADGALAEQVRRRLVPFWCAPATLSLLSGD